MLEYLEDIIGSNRYIKQILEIEEGLEKKNDERIDKTNLVKIVKDQLRTMQKEKDEAVNFILKERDYIKLANMLYFTELGEGVNKYNSTIETICNLKDQIKQNKEQIKNSFVTNQELV